MSRTTNGFAKLSRPRLYGTVPRERLFEGLDAIQGMPVTVVSAPPGAGKTTLVATYLESRKLGGIWYHGDSGDADPATFFHFLGLAAMNMGNRSRRRFPLPPLTPECTADLPGFARRFFRELFGRLPSPSALVIDNFQDLGEEPSLHAALAAGFAEAPGDVRVFLVSRRSPPDAYVRLSANRQLGLIGWDQIRLTADEVAGILDAAHLPQSPETVRMLHDRSGGWAAGLLLLAEQHRRGQTPGEVGAPDSMGQVFAYFAGQIFDDVPAAERELLMQMSFLPAMSERLVLALTGDRSAAVLLERLYRRHLFTDVRRGSETRYVFHALFREFLQHRAEMELDEAALARAARRAAALLEADGEPEDAMALYFRAGDHEAAEALVLAQAPALIGQGRWKVVVDWILALPAGVPGRSPWLQYWRGTALSGVQPECAREALARAHAAALDAGDTECVVLSAAGMIDSYFLEYTDFMPITPWITEADRMFGTEFRFSCVDNELRAHSAMLIGCTYREPDHPHIDQCARRVRDLLSAGTPADVNLRVTAGTHLALYGSFTPHLDEGLRASMLIVPLLSDPSVHLFRRAFGWAVMCWYACCASDYVLGDRALAEMDAMSRDEGVHLAERFACILGYFLDLDRNRAASGWRRVERFEAIMVPSQPYEVASLVNMKSWHGLYTDDVALTRRHSAEAVRLFERAGSIPHTINACIAHLWGCVEVGDETAAHETMATLRRLTCTPNMSWGGWAPDAAEAVMAMRRGDEGLLRRCLARLFARPWERLDYYGHQFSWCRRWAANLVAAAIAREVCRDNAARFARNFRLTSPGPDVVDWPWPVRIVTLGRFEVRVDDEPLVFAGRAPRRTLLLLKAIVALGTREVKDYRLIDALWPDEEGDVARDAFRVALHRLRRLMRHGDAILVEDGHVSLNPDVCWVDVAACDQALRPDGDLQLALRLYGGEFLPGDRQETWTAPCRERMRQRFLQRMQDAGEVRERGGRFIEAIELYQRALDAEPVAEGVVCGLMRCHRESGRPAEALAAYDRLARTLSARYGVSPGESTRRLFEEIRRSGDAPGLASFP